MYKVAIIALVTILLIPLTSHSFASNIEIDIHTGAADKNAPVKISPPSTSAFVGDTIIIGNGDTVPHEISSGTPDSGPDGKFDSGTLNPGIYFSYTLTIADVGTITFYDKNYPWIIGTIVVQEAPAGYKVIHNVGADVGDGKTTFDVQYSSVKEIIQTAVIPKQNFVDFTLVGQTNQSSNLVLRLPTGLIDGPFIGVWVDHQVTKNFTVTQEQGVNVFTIPIRAQTEEVGVLGSQVVPEFGSVTGIVLAISIIGIVLFARLRPIRRLG